MGSVTSYWPLLREAGFIPANLDLAPIIAIADLEIVFEILDGIAQKIHYLARRAEFEVDCFYIGDEIDLLASYIETGFNLEDDLMFQTYKATNIMGKSRMLDLYFDPLRRRTGRIPEKPRRRMTKWWKDILKKVEHDYKPRWSELAYVLLNASYHQQEDFEARFRSAQRKIRAASLMPEEKPYVSLVTISPRGDDVIVGLPFKQLDMPQAEELVAKIGADAAQERSKSRVLVITAYVEYHHKPYTGIYWIHQEILR